MQLLVVDRIVGKVEVIRFTLLHLSRLCPARNQGYSSPRSTFLSPTAPPSPLISFLCAPSPGPYYISACGFSFCSHYKLNFCPLSSSYPTQPEHPAACHKYRYLVCDLPNPGARREHFRSHHCIFCFTDECVSIS